MQDVRIGDVMSVTTGIVVHGCNAQGVMGSGIAKDIKAKYPQAFDKYMAVYSTAGLQLGTVVFSVIRPDLIIANAITQQHYGRDKSIKYVSYAAVRSAFQEVANLAARTGLHVHYPLIGAGLANGDWGIISDIIGSVFDSTSVERSLWLLPD